MTSPSSPVDTIEKALEGDSVERIAQNFHASDPHTIPWGKQKSSYRGTVRKTVRSTIEAMRAAGFEVISRRDYNSLASKAEAMKQRAEDADALAERLKLEAQAHAMEARTANSTINEIYQVVSGGKGEPARHHASCPVREKLEAMKREMAEKDARIAALEEALKPFAEEAGCYDPDTGDDDDSVWATPAYFKIRDLRRARALIGGGNASD